MQGFQTDALHCTTTGDQADVEVRGDGRVSFRWCISTAFFDSGRRKRGGGRPRLDEFKRAQIAELRSLGETAEQEEVRRAASALYRYASGWTMREAVEPTPYGIGWLRGLREAVAEGGPDALGSRDYRPPR